MLDSFSKDVVYTKMLPPYTQTLFVELIRFTPGQPESANGAPPRSLPVPSMPRSADPGPSSSHRHHAHPHHSPLPLPTPPTPVHEFARQPSTNGHYVPPPPPWSSQWHSITPTPAIPRRSEAPDQPPLVPLPISPHGGKKRKFVDDSPTPPDIPHGHSGPGSGSGSASGSRSPKQARRHPQTPVQPPASVPARAMQQTLSPSLAMIVSPVDTEPSPRLSLSVPYGSSAPPPALPPPLQPPPHPSTSKHSNTPPMRSLKLVLPKK